MRKKGELQRSKHFQCRPLNPTISIDHLPKTIENASQPKCNQSAQMQQSYQGHPIVGQLKQKPWQQFPAIHRKSCCANASQWHLSKKWGNLMQSSHQREKKADAKKDLNSRNDGGMTFGSPSPKSAINPSTGQPSACSCPGVTKSNLRTLKIETFELRC